MVLDNSGSMLDAAYSQKGDILASDENVTFNPDAPSGSTTGLKYQRCTDGDYQIFDYKITGGKVSGSTLLATVTGYDNDTIYAGYFEQDKWYKWTDGTYSPWQSGVIYAKGDRVYVNGTIYEAVAVIADDGKSTGTSITQDRGIEWDHILYPNEWSSITTYASGDFVWSGPQLYQAAKGNIGINPDEDTADNWTAVDSTWQSGTSYAKDDIVTYKGIYYEALAANTSKVPDEYSTTVSPVWKSLRQGAFEEISASDACPDAAGTEYKRSDDGSNTLCLSVDTAATPDKVTSFTAFGNFLNWAMASKFDVEKKILTGGKYNYYEKVMVSEHRGCTGSRLIKQVKLDDNAGYLTLGVRGSNYDETDPFMNDRVDTTDDTARLEILAITAQGFQAGTECQTALEDLAEGGACGTVSSVDECLATFGGESEDLTNQHNVLNHSLQFCSRYWESFKPDGTCDIVQDDGTLENSVSLTAEMGECEKIYNGGANFQPHDPSAVDPAYGAYFCYGIYNQDVSYSDRDGYLGRCWKPATGLSKTCEAVLADGECTGDPCRYQSGGDWFMNQGGFKYECKFSTADKCELTDSDWTIAYEWSNGSGPCTAGELPPGATAAEWDDDNNNLDECIEEAAIKYCKDNQAPEVIDPSDQGGGTADNWNLPGVLADSQFIAQLTGSSDPMAVMKGYIKEENRPQGILHSVAQDLRLGAMSFNNVGAATECKPENLTIGIERYCPQNNKDGAELLAELQAGDLVTDETDLTYGSDGRRHVDDLAGAINSIRATSWTPLAEALYGALGYYTQNQVFCLDKDSDGNCLEDDKFCLDYDSSTGKCIAANPIEDPVQAWCQDNHILLITEGESTADINELVTGFSPTEADSYTAQRPGGCECNPDNTDAAGVCNDDSWTGDGDATDAQCSDSIFASTYLDDMTWWGQHIYPLYRERCVADVDDRLTEKKAISTHLVTTGALTADTAGGECDPATLMTNAAANGGTVDYRPGESPEQLEDNLMAVLDDILSRASAGSAASVISSSRSGSGAVYQAVFWPEYEYKDSNGDTQQISWVGDVHSLFMTAEGLMYEDTDQNGKMTDADRRVIFYFSDHVNKTRGCYAIDTYTETGACPGDGQDICVSDGSGCVEIGDIKYLWSVNEQLEDMDVLTERKVYTWNDANNDGIVDTAEWFRLTSSVTSNITGSVPWDALNTAAEGTGRGPVTRDFLTEDDWSSFAGDDGNNQENDALDALIEWILGKDQTNSESTDDTNANGRLDKELRSRDYLRNDKPYTWRLGDIIHSTPTVVARPAESYHYIYRDPTYNDFADKWAKRRSVIYFGGNDGMLHAVNGGFYFENGNQFCCTDELNPDGTCAVAPDAGTDKWGNSISGVCDNVPNLGEELWAYIPYNLQPHLKCLPDKLYTHKYFVDQKPKIVDVQIFVEEAACRDNGISDPGCIHPGGWGTILVGSMRFGGAQIDAETLDDESGEDGIYDKRAFSSSFFILDITNPEADLSTAPLLLGEITRTMGTEYVDLNYTTGVPSMVIMRDGGANDVSSKWYLVMGNGPSGLDGTNTAQGKIALLPLEWLNGTLKWENGRPTSVNILGRNSIRIPNTEPTSGNEGGRFLVPKGGDSGTDPSYISDIISVDYNIDMTAPDDLGARYRTDAIYFGTVDGSNFAEYEDPDAPEDQFYWNGGGRIFRLVTKKLDATGAETASTPSEWPGMWKDGDPLRLLLDVKRPVIAAPSIGYDSNNYWIYAGTGRFFDPYDKTDDGWCVGTDGANEPTNPNCWCADGDATCNTNRSLNRFFGIKEPVADYRSTLYKDGFDAWATVPTWSVGCKDALFTWETINWDVNTQENSGLSQTVNTALATDPTSERPGQRGLMQSDNILVESGTGYLGCYHCTTDVLGGRTCTELTALDTAYCFPGGTAGPIFNAGNYTFANLQNYIAGTGCQQVEGPDGPVDISTGLDGWYYEFHDPRERNLGTSALLGGLLTFTSYQPYNDPCKAEGESFLYGLHYQTGTAPEETVFGHFVYGDKTFVMEKLSLGRGLSTTPSIHSGSSDDYDAKAFIQTSTGEIIEIEQKNLPIGNTKSGRQSWTDRCGN